MCHFDKEIEMMRKEKESRKRIYELYDTPIRQADVIPKMGIYVSIFPKRRFEKPANEDDIITYGLKLQPTLLKTYELEEEVARKGKTFCGCIFLDLDYYHKTYGKCTSDEMVIESSWAWERLCEIALGTPSWLIQIPETGGNVKNTKEYFISMSTFGLDVDHKQDRNKNDITPPYGEMYKEVKQRIIDLDLNVLFAYKTFSDPAKGERFRLIFKTDVPIFSWDLAHGIILLLQAMFPEYFDSNCTNVNRQFHGSNTPIEEKNPHFGKSIALDKYFRCFEKYLKKKDSANFAKNMQELSKKTGINLLNGIFHVRKVEISEEQEEQLRKEQEHTYNMEMFSKQHFCVRGNVCQKVFKDDNTYENTESLYYYIIVVRRFRTK